MNKKTACLMALVVILFSCLFISAGKKDKLRVVSVSPSVTEMIYLLGVQDSLVANTTYCTRPADAEKKEKIGSLTNINVEKIFSLKPDVVFMTTMSPKEKAQKLERLGIKVVVFSYAKSYEMLNEHLLLVGKYTGKEKAAKKIVEKSRKEVKEIREKTASLEKPRVFCQIGADPLWAATQDTFINDFIEFAGGENIVKKSGKGIYSREKVVEQNPDFILITTMGMTGEEEIKIWNKYDTMAAVLTGRIYVIDSYKLNSPNSFTFGSTLRELTNLFHPGLLEK